MMRSSVVFCLAVSFAMFGFGLTLQCYSCPDGTSASCEVKQQCEQPEDSCLKLTADENTYTRCMRYTDCDYTTLSVRYPLPKFTFSCCQSALCNGQGKTFLQKLKEFFG